MKLSQEDFDAIKNLIEVTLDEKLDAKLEEKLEEKLGKLPSKEEFYNQTDKIMKELKDMREEFTVQSGQIFDHSDRIESLEKIHPNGLHVSS